MQLYPRAGAAAQAGGLGRWAAAREVAYAASGHCERPGQVWASDITYLPMAHGSIPCGDPGCAGRNVLAFRLSNTPTAGFCVAALQEALERFGAPEIFNTDHGIAIYQ